MNREFMPEPSLLLPDKAATVHAMAHPEEWMKKPYPFGWMVKSVWLCEQMNEYERTVGYVYNVAVMRWIEQREGWEPSDENGSPLSQLIYNNQGFRWTDKLIADGWQEGHETMLVQAFRERKKIEVMSDNLMGGKVSTVCSVVQLGDRYYARPPRKRKYHILIDGKPVRLVPA